MLHKILTAVTALAVVASLLAGAAGQAAAVTGYDSAYFGESAFLTLGPGQSGQFAVGFNNTGSTGWLTGSASQVDLAICLPDKVTCNTTSPNAAFAQGWLSATDYATTSTTYVGPGQTGYFVYNVTVPAAAAPGTYRFNGDLALHGTASMIHPQGYYQDVQVPNVGAPAKLGCTAAPTSIVRGSTQTSTVTVTVQDANGNRVTTNNGTTITVSQAGSPADAVGTITPNAAAVHGQSSTTTTTNGVATYTLSSDAATVSGTDQLSAASAGGFLTGCLVNVTFASAGAATSISAAAAPSQFPAGTAVPNGSTITGTFKDAAAVTVNMPAGTVVTFTSSDTTICNFGAGNTASTTYTLLGSQSTATAQANITGVPGTCTVTVSSGTLTPGTATITTSTSGPAAKLAITSNTCSTVAINTACAVTVQVQDAAGNPVFANTPITLNLYQTGTTTACSATVTSTVPVGGAGNPATASTGTGSTVKFNVTDGTAQSCDVVASSLGLTSASSTATFTGFGTATNLTLRPVSQTIPSNGVATATLTACVRDASGNTVTSASDSISLLKTAGNNGTTIISANPTTTSSGCATFTVQSTGTPGGTDTYQAVDTTRSFTSNSSQVFTTP